VTNDPFVLTDLVSASFAISFASIALANLALVTAMKQAAVRLHKGGVRVLESPWVQAALELVQPLVGGLLGWYAPDAFPDFSRPMSAVLGVVAGFCSPLIYRRVVKQIAPDSVALPSDGKTRNGGKE
jgi:hypothetical protein